jgi:Protein of unknown function (DUF3810)
MWADAIFIPHMPKRKIIAFLILLGTSVLLPFVCSHSHRAVSIYTSYIYYPFQSFRGIITGILPFSIGDVLYVAGGVWVAYTFGRCIYQLFHFAKHKQQLAGNVLNLLLFAVSLYLWFFIGWGVNYCKRPLAMSWELYPAGKVNTHMPDSTARRMRKERLIAYEAFLLQHLNDYAPAYRSLSATDINLIGVQYYRRYTTSVVAGHGLNIKPSLFSWFLERVGIDGYYNPFTGEGQVNAKLPAFVLPFTMCHEMAHQAGIAAEDDANLLAYALCTASPDSIFRYSAYLSLWLYNDNRLFHRDSMMAKSFEARLNALTMAQIDTLDQLSKKYDNGAARASTDLYDTYLKMQDQKDGIRSYGNVTTSAWLLEKNRMNGNPKPLIPIPAQ